MVDAPATDKRTCQ